MILFIHGFSSCGLSQKSETLLTRFGADQVLTPDLPHQPARAIALLQSLRSQHQVDLLVGSSLGGLYATWLNGQRPIPTVLINPAVNAPHLLPGLIGHHTRWCDNAPFEFTEQDADALMQLHRPTLTDAEHYLVLLQTGDETLDYRIAEQYYRDKELLIEQGGSHRFENLTDHLERIADFRQRHTAPA